VILIVQLHPHHHTIHSFLFPVYRKAIPIKSTPTYAWDNSTLLCNQTHDPLWCCSDTKFHTVWGYPLYIWFSEKKCSLVFCNRFWNQTPVVMVYILHPDTTKCADVRTKWTQAIRGVCDQMGHDNHVAFRESEFPVQLQTLREIWSNSQAFLLTSVTHHTLTLFVSGWHKVHYLRSLVCSINQLQKS
jgi:hypothetical protein